jgi:hypothetical protein
MVIQIEDRMKVSDPALPHDHHLLDGLHVIFNFEDNTLIFIRAHSSTSKEEGLLIGCCRFPGGPTKKGDSAGIPFCEITE